jgi:two-component system, LytTR family, response regulator
MSSSALSVVIADDEALGRERVRIFIEALNQTGAAITISAECAGGREAVAAVSAHAPDILFLDIQMPDLDGFGVVDELSRAVHGAQRAMPQVIFVTAHDEHAVRAFDAHALDFLLKPVSRERFAAAIQRARDALAARGQGDLQARLLAWMAQERPPAATAAPPAGQRWLERIEVKNPQRWDYVPVGDILWMRADGNYIELVTTAKTHLVRETMQEMEAQLDPASFLRIGRSVMVNLAAVRALRPSAKGAPVAEMSNGATLPVQRNFDELQARLRFARVR